MKIKNWEKFQHYKHRNPPWVKLYRNLLDDIRAHKLSDGAFRMLINSILLASEGEAGELPDPEEISWRLRLDKPKVIKYLEEIDYCLVHDDSDMLADCKQSAPPEKRQRQSKSRDRERVATQAITYPPELNAKAWDEYKQYRRDNKFTKLKHVSEVKKIEELSRYTHEVQQRAVDGTISNGWRGIFPDKYVDAVVKARAGETKREQLNNAFNKATADAFEK